MTPRYRFALMLSAAFVLLSYKGLTVAPLSPLAVLLGAVLEGASLALVWLVSELAQRTRWPALRALGSGLFYLFFYAIVVCSLAHTFFFESAAERRFSLLEVDPSTLAFFFSDVLPARGAFLLGGLFVAIHLLAWLVARVARTPHPLRVGLVLAGLWLSLGFTLANTPRVPSPVADVAADVWEQVTTPEILIDRARPLRVAPHALDKSQQGLSAAAPLAFKKVLVFVMETMTSEVFERESAQLPASSFVRAGRAHAHTFSRYFATNQDSRTGMLSMLGSRFIPYEAYTEAGRDHYLFLGEERSLVSQFAELGYRTGFGVSQAELELVVADLPWHERLHLEPSEVPKLQRDYLCFVPYEFEHSCEDRALLPRVLSFIDRHERVFLYQEFVWGHAAEYNKASGKTNTEYYSAYLDAVLAHLKETGALADTLIVLTSDHGFRDKGLQTERAVYQLPLWFFAPRLSSARDERLFSHLDFKDLLLGELSPAAPRPAESPFVMVIGPTGTSFLAVLTQADAFMVMKARDDERYLLHAEGLAGAAEPTAADFLRLFEDYRVGFGPRRGQP